MISIISVLLLAVTFSVSGSSAQSRDAKRQADLRNLQQAIELYKIDNGRYPEGCNGPYQWSGQLGTDHACTGTGQYAGTGEYIVGLAPEYISVLPTDPRLPGGPSPDAGYVYTVNTAGTVYKIMALNTVEADTLLRPQPPALPSPRAFSHPFRSCAMEVMPDTVSYMPQNSLCHRVPDGHGGLSTFPPTQCQYSNLRFQSSYALWGGFAFDNASGGDGRPLYDANDWHGFSEMTRIICM